MNDREQIIRLYKEMYAAMVNKDRAELERKEPPVEGSAVDYTEKKELLVYFKNDKDPAGDGQNLPDIADRIRAARKNDSRQNRKCCRQDRGGNVETPEKRGCIHPPGRFIDRRKKNVFHHKNHTLQTG